MNRNKVHTAEKALDNTKQQLLNCSNLHERLARWDNDRILKVSIDATEVAFSVGALVTAMRAQLEVCDAEVAAAKEVLRLAVADWSKELGS